MTNTGNAVTVKNLTVQYGGRPILRGINFDVRYGEIMVVMGGSGSGKSTLLRHLLGLARADAGDIEIDGVDVAHASGKALRELRKRIGVAFQGGALLSSLSVADNVRLPLTQHTRLDAETINIMVRMKLELMNLAGSGELMPAQLSGGMRKRTGLARAVVMDPRILFFDEPSAGLDPVMSAELDDLILKLRAAMKMSIVVVTHDLDSAFRIADRITVLQDGEILACGTPDEIRAASDSRIQNMINRRARDEAIDGEAYLRRLTGDGAV